MKIILALNSFKGSCSSLNANLALKSGLSLNRSIKELKVFPLCDGGDGSIEVLHYHLGIPKVKVHTHDALGAPLYSTYLFDKKKARAYIELANASGMARLQSKPDILHANTSGTGKVIMHAIRRGANKIILMVGGSATNDAGIGILHELGIKFLDKKNKEFKPIPSNLKYIHSIDDRGIQHLKNIHFEVWTDVKNPFDGNEGAVAVYSKQKGADQNEQVKLEEGMIHFRKLIYRKYHIKLNLIEGTGAAGGVGGGLVPLIGARIKHGTIEIFKLTGFKEIIKAYDMIFTGEGSLDIQSGYGKLVQGVIKEAKKNKVPVIGVCGSKNLDASQVKKIGFDSVFSIVPGPKSLAESMEKAEEFIFSLGVNLGGMIDALMNK
ncbi:MAG: glycerate kinase [Saprospiraceae bacterium]